MNRRLLRAPLLLLALFATLAARVDALALNFSAGEVLPSFRLPDLEGKGTSLDAYRGRPVVVAFFSTWCSRCAEELAFLRDTFGERPDVVVLLVDQDGERDVSRLRLDEFRGRLSLPFPILLDHGLTLWDLYGIAALPTTLVVGGDGRLLHAEAGFSGGAGGRLLELLPPPPGGGEKSPSLAVKNASAGDITGHGGRCRLANTSRIK
jgi:peroxiredoxin